MTYKEGISLFKSRYRRYTDKTDMAQLIDDEVLLELSVIQSELQNTHYLTDKSSRNNSTPQVTITAGTSIYTAGSGAGNIPSDIKSIISVSLNDTVKTSLIACGIENLRDSVKPNGKPYRYALYLQNGNMTMELDTNPDTNYTMTIIYTPYFEIYYGAGGVNTCDIWSDVDYTATGYGGSFKLPKEWHNVIVDGALANVLQEPKLLQLYQMKVDKMLQNQAVSGSGSIPYNDSVNTGHRRILEPGQDIPFNWQWKGWEY